MHALAFFSKRISALAASPGAVAPVSATPVDLANYVPNHFTTAQLATLKAATGRIIPKDDLGPGANELGVFVYIDRALGGLHADAIPLYQAGLAALDAAAGSGGFAGLAEDKQDAILTNAEGGKLDGACDKVAAIQSVPYSADYVFLRKP